MRLSPRNLLWLLPLLLLLSAPLWFPAASRFLEPRGGFDPRFAAPVKSSPIQNFSLDSVSITLTSKGVDEWQIDAGQAYTGEEDNSIELVEVNAMYIGRKHPPTSIESNRGHYLVEARELVLMDKVRIRRPLEKQELRTELLHYFDVSKLVISPGDVEIISPGFHLNAGSMKYNLTTNAYDFGSRVRLQL